MVGSECKNCHAEFGAIDLVNGSTLGLCVGCDEAFKRIEGFVEERYKGIISSLREARQNSDQDCKDLNKELNKLNSDKYFYNGERITKEILEAQLENNTGEDNTEVLNDALKEIGRLRRFISWVANNKPKRLSVPLIQERASSVLDGQDEQQYELD